MNIFEAFFHELAEAMAEEVSDNFIEWLEQDTATPEVVRDIVKRAESKLTDIEMASIIAAVINMTREKDAKVREAKAQ